MGDINQRLNLMMSCSIGRFTRFLKTVRYTPPLG
nr:MAG TPA: myeloid antimicrobial peptide 27 PEPTIDE, CATHELICIDIN, ALPHA HELIX [Bacteriophage sp.]